MEIFDYVILGAGLGGLSGACLRELHEKKCFSIPRERSVNVNEVFPLLVGYPLMVG